MSDLAMDNNVASGSSPGARLQAARQGLGWTPEHVAEQLKWAPRQVLALEAGDYQALPGMATVRGFLRAYAKLVKLDPAPLVAQYDQQNGAVSDVFPVRRELATPFSEVRLPSMHKRGLSPASWGLIGALVLVVAVLVASHMGWLKPLPADLFGRKAQASHSASAETGAAASASTSSDAANTASAPDANAGGVAPASALAGSASTTSPAGSANAVVQNPAAGVSPASILPPLPGTVPSPMPTQAGTAPAAVTGNRSATTPTPAMAGAANGASAVTRPPVVSNVPVANVAANLTGAQANGANTAPGTGGSLVLKFRQDCWIEVKRVNGNVLLSRLLKAGETETLPMNEPVQLVVGNVAGVEATLRGVPVVLKNAAGNTARVILK